MVRNAARIFLQLFLLLSVARCLGCDSFEALAEARSGVERGARADAHPQGAQLQLASVEAEDQDGCVCVSGHAVAALEPISIDHSVRAVVGFVEVPRVVALVGTSPPIRPPIA
jgi:hypothetical protein